MKRLFSLPGACLVGLLLLPFLSGCKKESNVKLVPVQGKVTVEGGGVVTSGHVTFWPTEGKDAKAGSANGEIQSDGSYKLTMGGKEGAAEGQYKVVISPSMVPTGGTTAPSTPFNSSYTRQDTTPLMLHVPSNSYDLVLKK